MKAERTPTKEQIDAIDQRDSACVLSSGAGCGKTTVLTARYLSLLERDHFSISQIVAITFTERAAREMRRRIRQEIRKKVNESSNETDYETWNNHQRNLDSAAIQTIHAFCSALLHRYAAECGLDADFVTLDDAAASILRAESVQKLLESIVVADVPLTRDLHELVVLFGWSAVLENIEALLADPDIVHWQQFLARSLKEICNSWIQQRKQFFPAWLEYLASANSGIAGCFEAMNRIAPPTAMARKTFDSIRANYAQLASRDDWEAAIDELNDLAKVKNVGTKKQWPNESDYERVRDALEDFRKQITSQFDAFTSKVGEDFTATATVSQQFLRVAIAANEAYAKAKQTIAAIDFTDQIVLARNLLRDRPEIRKELTKQYRIVMVDEFQDTDPVQLELVRLLCGGENTPKQLFVVGDEKQSIYRFRGADVDLFRELRSAVNDDGRLSLSINFRSRPGIIRFVNALFSKRLSQYEPLKHIRDESGKTADVEFLWSVPVDDSEIESAEAVRSREADAIARRILNLIETDAFGKKDIVLLFRSMSNVAIYENALRKFGLDYYLVGGRAFFAQQEVYDLLNLLKSIENPYDGPALVGLLRSPFCGISDNALTLFAPHSDGVWAGLNDPKRIQSLPKDEQSIVLQAREHLKAWRAMKDRVPVSQLLQTIFAETAYDAATQFEPLADRKLANIWKLLDQAREYDRTHHGPAGFVALLNELVSKQPREEQAATRPEEDDVIRLMSIHQAKGLEFPVVFVPDLASRTQSGDREAVRWHRQLGCLVRRPYDIEDGDPEAFSTVPYQLGNVADQLADWQEDLRVLYVACTRAEERLILSAGWREDFSLEQPTPIPKYGINHWTTTLAERFDLRTGLPLFESENVNIEVNISTPSEVEVEKKTEPIHEPVWRPALPKLH